MARHEVALKGHEGLAEGTLGFRFEKPAGFAFRAGQSVSLTLLDPPAEPNSARRTFSLASAPFEDELLVATRMREGSAFKRALLHLSRGARVKLTGPLGAMTLHEDAARAALFIAGGIGITPFRSMLRQAEHDRLEHALYLLYSNRRREHAAFLGELEDLARRNPRFRLLAHMSDADGLLDEPAVKRFAGEAASPVYYLAGPPPMVAAMKTVLATGGVRPDDVRSEEFFGY